MLFIGMFAALFAVLAYYFSKSNDILKKGTSLIFGFISIFLFLIYFYGYSIIDDFTRGLIPETTEVKQYIALQTVNRTVIELCANYLPILSPLLAGILIMYFVQRGLYGREKEVGGN